MQSEPDEVTLDPDQFDRLTRILKRAGITSPQTAQTLARAVAETMSAYRAENAESDGATTFRKKRGNGFWRASTSRSSSGRVKPRASAQVALDGVGDAVFAFDHGYRRWQADRWQDQGLPPLRRSHDSLRELWRLTEQSDPPVGQIRARLRELPGEVLADIEERAERRWSIYFEEPAPATPTLGWLADIPKEMLLKILPPSISLGGKFVPGRGRGSGRRSKPQYEPMILGVVRGSRPSSKSAMVDRSDRDGNGRPSDDAPLLLISFLAMDWTLAADQLPLPGRSDKTPFGDLVHQVFGWLELPDATAALRRYWRERVRRVERESLHPVDYV
jgi:hypothetical protein